MVGSVLAGFLVLFAVPAAVVRGATLYEQLNASTLGETKTEHGTQANPTQKLGNGLSGAFSSISYRLHGSTIAGDFGAGFGIFLLYSCGSGSYTACPLVTSSPSIPHIISQSGNDTYILATTSSPYSFNPGLFYYLKWSITGDMALYGAASTTVPDTYQNGTAEWFDGSFSAEAKLSDVAFRICSGAVCDLTPPDTTAPVLAEVAAIATSTDTTPTYSFTSTEAGALAFSGSCSAATSSVGAGTTALTFAELAVGAYSNCVLSVTDAASNTGTLAVTPFTIEAVPPPEPTPPAKSSGGGGVIGGPLSVGYQVPYLPPPPPPAPTPPPAPEAVSPPAAAAQPEPPATAQTRTSDVLVPAAADAPLDKPVREQIPMGAAIATSGLQLPSFVAMAAALLLLTLGAAMALRHSKVAF